MPERHNHLSPALAPAATAAEGRRGSRAMTRRRPSSLGRDGGGVWSRSRESDARRERAATARRGKGGQEGGGGGSFAGGRSPDASRSWPTPVVLRRRRATADGHDSVDELRPIAPGAQPRRRKEACSGGGGPRRGSEAWGPVGREAKGAGERGRGRCSTHQTRQTWVWGGGGEDGRTAAGRVRQKRRDDQ